MKTHRILTACALALGAFQIPTPLHAIPFQYTVTDLGLAGQVRGNATGINASGQVAGYVSPMPRVRIGENDYQAIVWTVLNPTVLNGLGGTDNIAWGINDSGQVTGSSYTTGNAATHAVRWTGTTATDLGTLGGTYSDGISINAAGQVTGSSYTTGNTATHAVRWTGTTATDLGTLGGFNSYGLGINAIGQVAGISEITGSSAQHAVRWTGTTAVDLGTLGGRDSHAFGINNAGQVVGDSMLTGNASTHAVRWTGTTALDLGTFAGLNSYAFDINSAGDVLGEASGVIGTTFFYHPFIYTDGTMYDLETLLAPGSNVTNIRIDEHGGNSLNDSGQIAATGSFFGERHIIRLTPIAAPEPSPALLAAGAGMMAVLRRRRAAGK